MDIIVGFVDRFRDQRKEREEVDLPRGLGRGGGGEEGTKTGVVMFPPRPKDRVQMNDSALQGKMPVWLGFDSAEER